MLWLCIKLPEEKSLPRERATLRALAGWALQFSSHVSIDFDRRLLWLEAGASIGLFGGLDSLLARIRQGLQELGHDATDGVAPTLEAAALLTAAGEQSSLQNHGEILPAIADLPLRLLVVPTDVQQALRASGLHSIGEVFAIGFHALARRFGPTVTDYLQRLVGLKPDVRRAFRLPAVYRRKLELAGAIESVEGLLFPLRRLLTELQGALRAHDTGIQELGIVLTHHDAADTSLNIRTTRPQRDAAQLLMLLRERLIALQLPAPVLEIVLRADRFVALGDTQLDLFDARRRQDDGWQDVLDKLRARLGDNAIGRLGLADDHRPEKAWCMVGESSSTTYAAARPLWLLPNPQPLHELPRLCGQPERIESGWWDGAEICRDYYVAEATDGCRLWLYREIGSRQWFLHGLWS